MSAAAWAAGCDFEPRSVSDPNANAHAAINNSETAFRIDVFLDCPRAFSFRAPAVRLAYIVLGFAVQGALTSTLDTFPLEWIVRSSRRACSVSVVFLNVL